MAQLLIENAPELFPESENETKIQHSTPDNNITAIKVSWKLKHAHFTEQELEVWLKVYMQSKGTSRSFVCTTAPIQQIRNY